MMPVTVSPADLTPCRHTQPRYSSIAPQDLQ
jgi:hypothetical protein